MLGLLSVCDYVRAKTQTAAVSRLCARKCSRPIYDLILIIHADILHSAMVSNPRLQKLIVGH